MPIRHAIWKVAPQPDDDRPDVQTLALAVATLACCLRLDLSRRHAWRADPGEGGTLRLQAERDHSVTLIYNRTRKPGFI
jgi:hypothetical protein